LQVEKQLRCRLQRLHKAASTMQAGSGGGRQGWRGSAGWPVCAWKACLSVFQEVGRVVIKDVQPPTPAAATQSSTILTTPHKLNKASRHAARQSCRHLAGPSAALLFSSPCSTSARPSPNRAAA
jgi:hypothetical protein